MSGFGAQRVLVFPAAMFLVVACFSIAAASFAPLEKEAGVGRSAALPPTSPQLIDCSSAIALQIGDSVEGSTVGQANNIDRYGCSWWSESGGDVVYALSISEPTMFEIRLTADCDLDVALLSSCDADAGCLLVADTGIQTTEPMMGDFIIVVDGFGGARCDFALDVVAAGPSSVDLAACQTATPLDCEAGSVISGDTCVGEDYVWSLGCEDFRSVGTETWYRVTLEPGGDVAVDLTMSNADAVLWLLGGCGEAAECLDYSDAGLSGEQESVAYTNDGPGNRTVFLVVDSYGPQSCGAYEGEVVCNGVIVPTRVTSWSVLKARSVKEEK